MSNQSKLDAQRQKFAEALLANSKGTMRAMPRIPVDADKFAFADKIEDLIAWHVAEHQGNASLADPRRPMPDVIGGTIDSPTFNARSFYEDGLFFIGIDWGYGYVTIELFRRLLSYPEVLPWLGNAAAEHPFPYFDRYPLQNDAYSAFPPPGLHGQGLHPTDNLRKMAAILLSRFTNQFMVFHEFAHIYGCHLSYWEREAASAFMNEISEHLLGPEVAIKSQAFEWDADNAAMQLIMGNLLGCHLGLHPDNPDFWILTETKEQLIEVAFLVLDCVCKIFDLKEPAPFELWQRKPHPPAPVRRMWMKNSLLLLMEDSDHLKGLRGLAEHEIIPRVMSISDRITSKIFGQPDRSGFFLDHGLEIDNHMFEVFEKLRDLQVDLASLRFYGLSTWDNSS
jgi:hypothetical protein